MKLTDIFKASATRAGLKATTKQEVVEELVDALAGAGAIDEDNRDDAVAAIMKREKLGSTGIGRGMAIPHARLAGVADVVGIVGRSEEGVDFASLDGEPAYVFFLLLSPPDRPEPHMKALEMISTVLRDETLCRFIRNAGTKKELNELIREADELFAD